MSELPLANCSLSLYQNPTLETSKPKIFTVVMDNFSLYLIEYTD